MPSPPSSISELGLPGALYLAALLEAQQQRVRVAPTRRMTFAVLAHLRELGLIDVPWPEPRWSAVHTDAQETPLEFMQWRLVWMAHQPSAPGPALRDFLQSVPADGAATTFRLRMWQDLVLGEAERFLELLLAKHQFDPSWALDLTFLEHVGQGALSVAQWRYCCWAAVRHGASVAQQQRTADPAAIREAVHAELRRRLGLATANQWGKSFTPFNLVPESALTRIFVRDLTRLADDFWTAVPDETALMSFVISTSRS